MGMVDVEGILFGQSSAPYAVLGTEAVLALCGGQPPLIEGADGLPLVVIDKTAGVVIGFKGAEVQTIRPAADIRTIDLATVDLETLRNATLTLKGKDWTVIDHAYKDSQGEIRMILEEAE